MKRNRIGIIVVIILGAFSFWFVINKRNGTIKETLRNFAVIDTASINKIFLADKKGRSVTVERKSSGAWMVNGKYIARPDVIQTLLYTIRKVDIKEPIGKAAEENVIKELAANAIRCEIYQNNELTKAYYVGSETIDQTGTYMILIDLKTMAPSAKPFVTYIPGFEGYLTTRYLTEEAAWRDRTVFQYIPSDIRSVKFELPLKPELGYEVIVKGNNNYEVKMLSTGKAIDNLDTISVKQYLSYFQHLNFESFEIDLNRHQVDSVLKTNPINILTVTDNTGKTNNVKFYPRKPKHAGMLDAAGKEITVDNERMDALLNNGKDFVILQYFQFGKIMPAATYFQKNGNSPLIRTK